MSFQPSSIRFKEFATDGTPLAGGRLYTYASGTTTHKAVYTDATLATPASYTTDGFGNKYLSLDARGEARVWLGSGAYTFVVTDSIGANGRTTDGIEDPESALASDLASTTDDTKGAGMVWFKELGTGMVSSKVLDRLRERSSLQSAGATANTGSDEHVKMQTAVAAAKVAGRAIFIPPGTNLGYIDIPAGSGPFVIYGEGPTSILKLPNGANRPLIQPADTVNGVDNVFIYNFLIDGNEANQDPVLGLDAHGVFADGGCDNWRIRNMTFQNTKGNGVRVRGSGSGGSSTKAEFIDISECRFEDAGHKDNGPDGRDSIYLNGLQCARVVGNDIIDAGRQAVALEGSVASSIATRKIVISLNYAKNATSGAFDDEANNGGQLVITSNMAEDCLGTGVRSTGDNGNTIVSGNWLRNCGNGIDIENDVTTGDAGIVVSSNIVDTTTAFGIKINKGNFATIESNQVYAAGTYGFHILGDDVIGLELRGNKSVESVGDGFLIAGYGRGCSFISNFAIDSGVPGATAPGFNWYASTSSWTRSVFAFNHAFERRSGAARGMSNSFRFANQDRCTYSMNVCDGNAIANDVLWDTTSPTLAMVTQNTWSAARWTGAPSSLLDDGWGLRIGSSDWDSGHLVMGDYHIWVDNTGDLRIKASAPTGDTDGTVVGAQS